MFQNPFAQQQQAMQQYANLQNIWSTYGNLGGQFATTTSTPPNTFTYIQPPASPMPVAAKPKEGALAWLDARIEEVLWDSSL